MEQPVGYPQKRSAVLSFPEKLQSSERIGVEMKWYITGGHRATQTDCDVEPIISEGKDRIEAIANSGITVWSEEDWLAFDHAGFQKTCDELRKLKKEE